MPFAKNNSTNKAFSLIEMSIVIVVLSIMMLVVLKGRSLVYDSRVSGAAYLTNNSIVTSIDGLEAWYETTLEASFNPYEKFDGKSITKWFDIDPTSTTVKNNLVQNGTSGVPNYEKKCINNLPCINFNSASSEYLIGENELFIKGDSAQGTIFIVGLTSTTSNSFILSISGGAQKTMLLLDVNANSSEAGFRFNGANRLFNSPFTANKPFISTWRFSEASLPQYYDLYVNGVKQTQLSIANNAVEIKNDVFSIGAYYYSGSFYGFHDGKISEIIIFNKYLSDKERVLVEKYLSKKFAIELN